MLLYCTSMDIYGTGTAPCDWSAVNDAPWTADWSVEASGMTLIGDTWNGTISITSANSVYFSYGNGYGIGTPSWGARRGEYALFKDGPTYYRFGSQNGSQVWDAAHGMQMSIPGSSQNVRIIHCAFSLSSLPVEPNYHGHIVMFCDSFGNCKGLLGVNPSGRLVLYTADNYRIDGSTAQPEGLTAAAVSGSPVIDPETWYSINIKIDTSAGAGLADVQVYVGDIIPANLVIDASNVQFEDTTYDEIDVLSWLPLSAASALGSGGQIDGIQYWIRDVVLCDNTGSYNNDLLGQVFVAAQEMRVEDAGGGWTAYPRENIGTGILDHKDANTGLRLADTAALELGAGAFTVEGFWRFDELPSAEEAVLMGKWSEDDNARSYKLTYDSSDNSIKWVISTDGSTVTEVQEYPFDFDLQKYYHIAVSREVVSGVGTTRMFVNGTQIGVDRTDNNTYHDGAAALGICARFDSGNTIDADQVFKGWLDEFRLTKGVARYTTDFSAPTTKFGRNGTDDTDFSSVSVLLGFDGSITDESSNAFTVTAGAGVQAETPNDSANSYEVLNQRPAWDDTFIEAQNTFATGVLTLSANPSASETITVGSVTYTYVTSFSSSPANEILIGAAVADTITNTIAAINGGAGSGTLYGTGTVANTAAQASALPDPQMALTAATIGATGNSVATTETLASGEFGAATLEGGQDVPAPSDFAIERLPTDVTGVLGMQVTARGYKSDAGSAQVRFDLVGPSAGVATGGAQGADLNPSWLRQVFEEDPDTAATITPSTITAGRVRVTRTA